MRAPRATPWLLVLSALAASGCAARSSSPLGRAVTLVPVEKKAARVQGELVAVDEGRIWVKTKDGLRDFDPAALREVRVRRHNLTAGWAIRWGLLSGIASGTVMAAACSSVEGNDAGDCAPTAAVWGGIWALVGALAAPSLDASSRIDFDPSSSRLAPYARFPAGLPRGVAREALVGPPAPKRF